jgi:hypothetical protein
MLTTIYGPHQFIKPNIRDSRGPFRLSGSQVAARPVFLMPQSVAALLLHLQNLRLRVEFALRSWLSKKSFFLRRLSEPVP